MPLPRPIFSGSFRVYSLIWDAHEILEQGGGECLALL